MNNDLMQRYLYAVGRHLPEKGREDILRELESDILERLEHEDGSASEGAGSQDRLEALLLEFGEPSEVGSRYGGKLEYLIGSGLYPIYVKVLRLVLVIGLSLMSFVHLIGLVFNPADVAGLARLFADWFSAVVNGALTMFASVTISFAITERALRKKGEAVGTELAAWKPSSLPMVPDSVERIKPAGLIVGILFSIFFIVLLLFRRDDLGVILGMAGVGSPVLIPILNEKVVATFLWVIIALLAVSTINAAWKLISGRYTFPTRLLSALLCFAGAATAIVVLNQPELLDASRGLAAAMSPEKLDSVLIALRLSLRITSFAVAIPNVVEGVQHLLKLRGSGTVNKL